MMNKLVIYGTGGLGRGILDLIEAINYAEDTWELIGFIDDDSSKNELVNNVPVLGGIEYLQKIKHPINVVLAFGNPEVKKSISYVLQKNKYISFPNLIHPNVYIPKHISMGIGNIISQGVALSANIKLGDFNLIHFNSSIGHDVTLNSYNSIYPLSAISGYVRIANQVIIGANTSVIPSKNIGSKVTTGAGSVVIKDVEDDTTVVGVPARPVIKEQN